MKTIILAVVLAASPVLAHGKAGHHGKAGTPSGPRAADVPSSFEKQPGNGTWAKCPVSGEVFQVEPDTEFATYEGRVYAFCCPDCKPDFDKDPAKFAAKKRT
jgi:YHS domain-containing protein